MTMIRKMLVLLAAAFVVVGIVSVPTATAVDIPLRNPVGVSGALSAVSTDVGMWVKWVGPTVFTTKPTVAVAAADSDMAFTVNGAADTTITGCGGTAGTLDTAQAACDTIIELCNTINTSANWACALENMLGSTTAVNTLITLGATDASTPGGVAILKDTVVALDVYVSLRPGVDMGFFLAGPTKLNKNPVSDTVTLVQSIRENITSAGVIGNFEVLGVKRVYGGTSGKTLTETVRTMWSEVGAATTVEKTANFWNFPLMSQPGEIVLVHQSAGTGLTAPKLNAVGVMGKVAVVP
jgi:hypothetical protein